MTDELVAWLREQVDADKRAAQKAAESVSPAWQTGIGNDDWTRDRMLFADGEPMWDNEGSQGLSLPEGIASHIARHDPARVLAEVAAKRRIIDRYEFVTNHGPAVDHVRALDMSTGARAALLDVVKMLASVYAGRPGWREEWAADEEVTP